MNDKTIAVLAELDPEKTRENYGRMAWILARSSGAQRALAIGTVDGYTTIWLTDAISESDGSVLTVESDETQAAAARSSVDRAGLEGYVEVRHEGANTTLAEYEDNYWDIVVLNACDDPLRLWYDIRRTLRPRGLLVVGPSPEFEGLLEEISADPSFVASRIGAELLVVYNHES
ncbi:MAG: class I SAM-dependent methyltransferase [Thermomicrobiales bacterium]